MILCSLMRGPIGSAKLSSTWISRCFQASATFRTVLRKKSQIFSALCNDDAKRVGAYPVAPFQLGRLSRYDALRFQPWGRQCDVATLSKGSSARLQRGRSGHTHNSL